MLKRIALVTVTLLLGSQLWAASTGLIVVLSSLSCTALSAVNSLTENVLFSSSQLEKMKKFVEDNDLILSAEMSRADGESLDAVADIAEVPEEKRTEFYSIMQENYSVIYPEAEVEPEYRARTILEISELL